ncbi:MAG: LuxR C-terminal-related transcriptional regulator [Alphaproteobacteria bacterium]
MEESIAVIDASRLARAGLVSLLRDMGFGKIYEADALTALEAQEEDINKIEIMIVRVSDDRTDPKEIMTQARNIMENPRVMFLVPRLDVNLLSECFSAGASGYLSESASQETLMGSLRLVKAGGKVFPEELAELIPSITAARRHRHPLSASDNGDGIPEGGLSDRELDILRELGNGQPNKVIANELGIAEATVKVYVKRVLKKIGVHNRTQAALWAATRGLVGKS